MKRAISLLAVLLLALASPAFSDEPKKDGCCDGEAGKAYEKFGTPGEQHAMLKSLDGEWDAVMKMCCGDAPKETKGTSTYKMVLGGRWSHQSFEGTCPMTGKPFSGFGQIGYDNFKKKFVGTWTDNFGTGLCKIEGTADSTGKVITFTNEWDDVATGTAKKTRSVLTIVDAKKHTFAMFDTGPDGKEFQLFEITYTRK